MTFTLNDFNTQKKIFFELSNSSFVNNNLTKLNGLNDNILKSEWKNNINVLYDLLQNKNKLNNFLLDNQIQSLFFVNSQGDLLLNELSLIENTFSKDEIEKYVRESILGNPPFILNKKYNTTHNTIHHLYHLVRYYKQCSTEIKNIESVIEWGGGYGNMCKIVNNFVHNLKTYCIIDLPECIILQYLYLSSLYGTDNVHINFEGKIIEGKINLMTFDLYQHNAKNSYDMFLSTWALSESPIELQNKVFELNWFNCNKLLMSFHQCGNHIPFMNESTNLGFLAKKSGASLKNIQVIPGVNVYAFR